MLKTWKCMWKCVVNIGTDQWHLKMCFFNQGLKINKLLWYDSPMTTYMKSISKLNHFNSYGHTLHDQIILHELQINCYHLHLLRDYGCAFPYYLYFTLLIHIHTYVNCCIPGNGQDWGNPSVVYYRIIVYALWTNYSTVLNSYHNPIKSQASNPTSCS